MLCCAAPPVEYDVSCSTEVVGRAVLQAGAGLVDGYSSSAEGRLEFRPVAALLDEQGLRMPLKDARHASNVVATAEVAMTLHADMQDDEGDS